MILPDSRPIARSIRRTATVLTAAGMATALVAGCSADKKVVIEESRTSRWPSQIVETEQLQQMRQTTAAVLRNFITVYSSDIQSCGTTTPQVASDLCKTSVVNSSDHTASFSIYKRIPGEANVQALTVSNMGEPWGPLPNQIIEIQIGEIDPTKLDSQNNYQSSVSFGDTQMPAEQPATIASLTATAQNPEIELNSINGSVNFGTENGAVTASSTSKSLFAVREAQDELSKFAAYAQTIIG